MTSMLQGEEVKTIACQDVPRSKRMFFVILLLMNVLLRTNENLPSFEVKPSVRKITADLAIFSIRPRSNGLIMPSESIMSSLLVGDAEGSRNMACCNFGLAVMV